MLVGGTCRTALSLIFYSYHEWAPAVEIQRVALTDGAPSGLVEVCWTDVWERRIEFRTGRAAAAVGPLGHLGD